MCGIAGFSLTEQERTDKELSFWLACGLLTGIEERGRNATGYAYFDREAAGNMARVRYYKLPETASKFIEDPIMERLDGRDTVILHTRAATKGSPTQEENNHPIVCTDVVGVHNGIVNNDDEIFTEKGWPRVGIVDSEVLFKFIEMEGLRKTVAEVEGDAAIAYLRSLKDPSVLNLAALGGRPLVVARLETGGLVFASTRKAIDEAANWAEVEVTATVDMKPGTAMAVRDGQIITDAWEVGELKRYSTNYTPNEWGYGGRGVITTRYTTPSYKCDGCEQSKHGCICDLQVQPLAEYPYPPNGALFGKGVGKWTWVGALMTGDRNGEWDTLHQGYRVGKWIMPHSVYSAWRDESRELKAEAEAIEEQRHKNRTLSDSEAFQELLADPVYKVCWTDESYSVVYLSMGATAQSDDWYLVHFDGHGIELDWATLDVDEVDGIVEGLTYAPTFKEVRYRKNSGGWSKGYVSFEYTDRDFKETH